MSRLAPEDLEPAERHTQELLAGVPPQVLPLDFRDAVMRQIAATPPRTWEWIIAAALAIPSLAFLVYQYATHGDEFAAALNNVMAAAAADTADAFFFIDGATVLALALVGIASLIGAHAVIAAPRRRAAR
jgi:hypothetical protein